VIVEGPDLPQDSRLAVDFATVNGTAESGSDFVANTGSIDFRPGGEKSQQICIQIIDDDVYELVYTLH